jgi:hypothetical protein
MVDSLASVLVDKLVVEGEKLLDLQRAKADMMVGLKLVLILAALILFY